MMRGFAVLSAALFLYLVLLAGALNSPDFANSPDTDMPSGQATPTATPTCVPASGAWVVRAPLPYQARGVSLASDGNYIYANGGATLANTQEYHAETSRYDPVANVWTPLAPSPDAHGLSPAVYGDNGKIYSVGGDTDAGSSNANRIYDIATDTWTSGAPLPVALSEQAAGYYNGKIYTVGGPGAVLGSAATWSYDIATDTWTQLADMPQSQFAAGFGMIDGKLYIAGGDVSGPSNIVFAYDITLNSWAQLANLPLGVAFPGSGVVGGKLWVFGGSIPEETNVTQIYDPATNTWSSGPPLNVARAVFFGTTVGNDIAAIGGGTGPGLELDTNEISSNPPGICATNTPTPRPSPAVPTATPTMTFTPCPINFSDVHPSDYFYAPVRYLYCAGAISGYADRTFRPYANTTRGQLAKIVVLAEDWPIDTTGGPHFFDVPASNPFYPYIETAYNHRVISGYSDGNFRWGINVTRAQLSKIVVNAEGWFIDTTGGPHFSDVPVGDAFYGYIETSYNHRVISGYADGTFRPGNNATRGQISKIVYSAITQH